MCYTPFTTKDGSEVPCGKCPLCIKRKVSAWSFRLLMEYKRSTSAHFITLTYGQRAPVSNNRFMELRKSDLQKFFKRLRKYHRALGITGSIRYYAVGEYGSKTQRPHYHAIIFNSKPELISKAWTYERRVITVYGTKAIKSIIPRSAIGAVYYGTLTPASCGYVLKYLSKPPLKKLHARDDRQPQFSLMSKKLGDNYLTPAMRRWHYDDLTSRTYIHLQGGKKASLPRYFKDKLYPVTNDTHPLQHKINATVGLITERQIIGKSAATRRTFERYFQLQDCEDVDELLRSEKEKMISEYRKMKLHFLNNQKL